MEWCCFKFSLELLWTLESAYLPEYTCPPSSERLRWFAHQGTIQRAIFASPLQISIELTKVRHPTIWNRTVKMGQHIPRKISLRAMPADITLLQVFHRPTYLVFWLKHLSMWMYQPPHPESKPSPRTAILLQRLQLPALLQLKVLMMEAIRRRTTSRHSSSMKAKLI